MVIFTVIAVLLLAALASLISFGGQPVKNLGQLFAGVFFTESVNSDIIRGEYISPESEDNVVKVLIVPGHDKESVGTEFRGVREADINLTLSKELFEFLSKDKRILPVLIRDDSGYNPEFDSYVALNREKISDYITSQKGIMKEMLDKRILETTSGPYHNAARSDVAFRIYAGNVWAREIGADIVINVHFNDHARRNLSVPGQYSGFAVYVPERQYSNAKASRELGEAVFSTLSRYYPVSDQPKESGGVVEDQELIALGSNNTLDAAGILVEYGYIYEPHLLDKSVRNLHLKEMAFQTYRGVLKFLNSENLTSEKETLFLPYAFERGATFGDRNRGVVSLQAALLFDGSYPPKGFSMSDCPLSGLFRQCTMLAVKNFQSKYGITSTGVLDVSTTEKLNSIYGTL